jgi:hypothetical protein
MKRSGAIRLPSSARQRASASKPLSRRFLGAEQGLVPQLDLLPGDCASQLRFQFQSFRGGAVQFLGEELVVCPAERLGVIHRGVGIAQQSVRGGAVVREQADPDRRDRVELDAVQGVGCGQLVQKVGGHVGSVARARNTLEHHHELVPAQACDGVGLAHGREQALTDLNQQVVAHLVAEGIVDVLETVEIEEQYRQRLGVAARVGDRLLQPRIEREAVGEPRQRIVVGQMLDVRFGLLALRDVGEDGDVVRHDVGIRIAHGRHRKPAGIGPAVRALSDRFAGEGALALENAPHRPGIERTFPGADPARGEHRSDRIVARCR